MYIESQASEMSKNPTMRDVSQIMHETPDDNVPPPSFRVELAIRSSRVLSFLNSALAHKSAAGQGASYNRQGELVARTKSSLQEAYNVVSR